MAFLTQCSTTKKFAELDKDINILSEKYVRLALYIGQYDGDFVDAYYGPDIFKPASKDEIFPKDSLLHEIKNLSSNLSELNIQANQQQKKRINWIKYQLRAFQERVEIFSGNTKSFDEEASGLFNVTPPHYPDQHYKELLQLLNVQLPGEGNLENRLSLLTHRFIIPKDKIDTVFKTAIAEARKRTLHYYALPQNENFRLEYVTNKPWSGYNWYEGNYQSLIQINVEGPIFIERAIDLACHEGYPGHHVYNMLLEQNLYRNKGWKEISLYPLFSPQSLIAEGSANYGIELAFPGNEKNAFIRNVLLPLAGMDTTYLDQYLNALTIMKKLNFLRNEVATELFNKTIDEAGSISKLMSLGLMGKESAEQNMRFVKKYRSYVINYNYGLKLITDYIEKESSPSNRWKKFYYLLSNPVTTEDLLAN